MFTGLVLDVGTVRRVHQSVDGLQFVVDTALDLERLALGASVSCSGICLTVAEELQAWEADRQLVSFFVGPTTLQKTTLSDLQIGTRLNLEPALRYGDALGGHQVQGHVDGTATVCAFEERGATRYLTIHVCRDWLDWMVPQGSLAINGVSLTVATLDFEQSRVTMMLIPHTLAVTNLSDLKVGDRVNVECDMQIKAISYLLRKLVPPILSKHSGHSFPEVSIADE